MDYAFWIKIMDRDEAPGWPDNPWQHVDRDAIHLRVIAKVIEKAKLAAPDEENNAVSVSRQIECKGSDYILWGLGFLDHSKVEKFRKILFEIINAELKEEIASEGGHLKSFKIYNYDSAKYRPKTGKPPFDPDKVNFDGSCFDWQGPYIVDCQRKMGFRQS